ncbi:MAG: hypothetical protein Q7T45_24585 [Bradyrhizobium sp.]|uniref:hypothetical protein n=1 Tax=Bradyrhizobium sp. TaxID=376 RepID=UPI0027261C2C|nr:hypothetical protein [Bradyrhizobium sp.]MDO8400997.1 hypothetical protein [Bradyrhizobium sp.]
MAVGLVTFAAFFVGIVYIYQWFIKILTLKLPVILPVPLPVGNGILSDHLAQHPRPPAWSNEKAQDP